MCIIPLSVRSLILCFLTALTSYLAINLLGSPFETDSSVTEPETDEVASDVEGASDHSNDSDNEDQGGNQGDAIVRSTGKPRTARKQQFDEVSVQLVMYLNAVYVRAATTVVSATAEHFFQSREPRYCAEPDCRDS
jgi:hypothetical protein